ncbi:MAG TPA: 3-oxoacyl-[acyl-carrier-protein] synthase III C-terminal domain-containing protein [Alphaproteobacteria bacterium]|nr:3-oxoacyl-[acyl-carrier-protein] synthase III C-terminal domain-containing protein [Alphaproteobacteria bacterium]
MNDVFINSFGAFLPGEPVSNAAMEQHLGMIGGQPSRHRALVLRQNRIKTRHYALDHEGRPLYTNAEMASRAIKDAIENSEISAAQISYLATSTTIADMLLPGLASHVHAELKLPPLEIASFQSVCASALMALKSAYTQIRAGEHQCAAVSGSEFASRYFRPGFYEHTRSFIEDGHVPLEADFLRFTLSDGAGAAILENKPNSRQLSFKILWIDLRSYADKFDTCMTAGASRAADGTAVPWGNYGGPHAAAENGALMLTQDFTLLQEMIPVWVSHYLDLLQRGRFRLEDVDILCSHYSSHSLREDAVAVLRAAGALVPEEKWFSNLYTRGNTGTASIFIMLEELCREKQLARGQKILCHVPESGRCLNGLMMLEVV